MTVFYHGGRVINAAENSKNNNEIEKRNINLECRDDKVSYTTWLIWPLGGALLPPYAIRPLC